MREDTQIICFDELRKLIPLSRSTIWRMERAGEFPQRIRIGKRRVGWRYSEVLAWIDSRQGQV